LSRQPTPRHWTGPQLEASGAHLVTLESDQVEYLAKKLPDQFGTPRSEDDALRYRDEAVLLLGDLAGRILDRTLHGPGLAIVTGDGLEQLSDARLGAMLYGLSLVLGRPMAQNPAGDRIVSVRDEHPDDPNTRGYRTNKPLLMHTDAADVAGLLCLSQGRAGGSNMFTSAETLHDTLSDEAPDLLAAYYRPWRWSLGGLQREGIEPTLSQPIYSYYAGRLRCRYASALLRQGAERAGRSLTAEEVAALDRFEEAAHRPGLQLRYTLRRGESMWLDNYLVLHGREGFTDAAGPGPVRHLLRTWIWLHDGPTLAPGFASPREIY
jgi:hypothetical protein